MTRPSQEIEREVEATRGDLDRTVEALKEKMSPGQLLDELTYALKGTGASDMVANLGSQVRDNPLPLAMIGAGMVWLMMGKGVHAGSRESTRDASAEDYDRADAMAFGAPGYSAFADGELDGGGPGLKEKAAGLAHRASDTAARAGQAASEARERVAGAADQARRRAQALRDQAGRAGQTIQRTFMDTLEQEPLIIGALGLAVGAAIGAALPPTKLEDRSLGRMRDKVLDEGRIKARQAVEGAKDAAEAAYQSARDEAQQQGLTGAGEGGSLVDKAENVLRAGVEAAREQIDVQRQH